NHLCVFLFFLKQTKKPLKILKKKKVFFLSFCYKIL
ncbi:unnamed protein product, partial [Staurois parvus]